MRFDGKIALVTGASRGIGRAIALRLAREGASVVVGYRREAGAAETVVREIAARGAGAIAVQADLASPEDVDRLFRTVGERLGALDVFVANAAATAFRPLLEQKEHNITRTFDLVVRGFLQSAQRAVPLMASRKGKIVTVSGFDAIRVIPGHGLLAAGKGALEVLTRYLAWELAGAGINVNGVCPGVIDTDSARAYAGPAYARLVDDAGRATPAGRIGTPEDVAGVVAFLCSDDADFIRGQTLVVDGGLSLHTPIGR